MSTARAHAAHAAHDAHDAHDAHTTPRTTESPLRIPSFGVALRVIARAFRLRCPHCGKGRVLATWAPGRPWGTVRPSCSQCGFRYERSDDRYFAGAMLVNLLTAELLFFVSFVSGILLTRPNVPWDAFTYGGAAAMLLLPALLYPFSKVMWLAVDVLVRPVAPTELIAD